MKFLGNIAKAFYERDREEISKICFVFPGRRASLFFQRELSALIDKPLFSPSLITISDLFSELSGLETQISLIVYTGYISFILISTKIPNLLMILFTGVKLF